MPALSDIFPGCNTVLNDTYSLSGDDALITLEVSIGYAQNANSFVHLNGQMIPGQGPAGAYTGSFVASLPNVKAGDTLTVSTTVYDINPSTDMTSVDVGINGQQYPGLQCEAPNSGSMPYYIYISFTTA